jgi:hypothetical protein
MTLHDFEQEIVAVALASDLCDIPIILRLTASAIKLRVALLPGGFIDAFYNEETGTTAFAWIRNERRVFGADNTGGWHLHPFSNPRLHETLSEPLSFQEFVAAIEQHVRNDV